MKTSFTSRSDFYSASFLLAVVLCLSGVLLASAEWTKALAQTYSKTALVLPDNPPSTFPESVAHGNTNFTYKLITTRQNKWGYDVFADGRLMIHQTNVPALSGNEGFKTKEDAAKVAQLVIEKLRKYEMPPTISVDEMKQLNVIK